MSCLGSFDRTLGPTKYNYSWTLVNLSKNFQMLNCYREHCLWYYSYVLHEQYVCSGIVGNQICMFTYTCSDVKFCTILNTYNVRYVRTCAHYAYYTCPQALCELVLVNPPGAGLATCRRLYHVSQVRVWSQKVPSGFSLKKQVMNSWYLLSQFTTGH